MLILGIDHVAIPTFDAERLLNFYKQLGFEILNEERWRRGLTPIFSILVGDNNMINVHPEGFTAELRGTGAMPGCGDFCFVWGGTIDEVLHLLYTCGVEPVSGPVARKGGRDKGRATSKSVYIHDPDGNLLEFMVYE